MKTTHELVLLLKSGEYDGGDLMQAWCRLEQLQQERDQLAATVDRLRMQLMTLNDIAGEAMGDKSYDWHVRATSATNGTYSLLRDTPEQSLARHDAELLRRLADEYDDDTYGHWGQSIAEAFRTCAFEVESGSK